MQMHITLVAGTRPNFVKISPIIRALQHKIEQGVDLHYRWVHTGQHYDKLLSDSFFEELDIPTPDSNLGVGSGSQATQTGEIMTSFEDELKANPTDMVIVVGDVTSTMACAIVAKKMNVLLAHVEAGIRSFDRTMPEEINRLVTDSITDYFFTTSRFANENLKNEGVPKEKIFFVGNVMIDTLLNNKLKFKKPALFDSFNLASKKYFVLTLHRPNNVDNIENLNAVISSIITATGDYTIIFPAHPRTVKNLEHATYASRLKIVPPQSYLEFNYLVQHAFAVITDSGGITEETTVLGIPCLTLRDNTERPETCEIGTNRLIGTDPTKLEFHLRDLFEGNWPKGKIPELWDGATSQRIVDQLTKILSNK